MKIRKATLALLLGMPPFLFAQGSTMLSPAGGATADPKLALIPMPREVKPGEVLSVGIGLSIAVPGGDADDQFTAKDLMATLKDRGINLQPGRKGTIRVVLLRAASSRATEILAHHHINLSAEMHDEGYVLVTEGSTVYNIAATSAGLYYGVQTIKQLITGRGSDAQLQTALIRDWPAMKYRGLSDDISRGPIPTLAFQEHEVRLLSEYKMNIYSPYLEVSLAYGSNPLLAPPGGAMTRSEVEELVAYAEKYHVTIVPDQEAFGHLHHALMVETYSPLAETPHGSSLAPGQPGSIQLVRQWFREIASMYPGPFIHIGADEVSELGTGQSKQIVAQKGVARAYFDFLGQIYTALKPLHKKMLFWGDIAMQDPELVKSLPKDMIAVAWEYSPQPQGFERQLRPFMDAGIETWVSPSVKDWNRVYPENYDALLNIQEFVRDGQHFGSTGMLNAEWSSDEANETLFNNVWYGVLFGAAASWQAGESSIPQLENSYGQVFHGDTTGKINQAQMEITAAQVALLKAGFVGGASTDLFWVDPWSRQGQIVSAKLLPVAHEIRMHAERAIILTEEAKASGPLREMGALDAMELGARRIDFIGYKFQAAQEIADAYNLAYQEHDGKRIVGSPLFHIDYQYEDLANAYGLLHDIHQRLWKEENRPYALHNVLLRYDLNTELWMQRMTLFTDAKAQFAETHVLPKPEDIGIPAMSASVTSAKMPPPLVPAQ